MHTQFGVPHVVVTSVRFGDDEEQLSVIGSSRTSAGALRLFKIEIPALQCFFSGTGDMFAALMVVRLREACLEAGLLERRSWVSDDEVKAVDLPLAKATQKVLASMQMVLEKTMKARNLEMERFGAGPGSAIGVVDAEHGSNGESKRRYLAETKAAEVRIVRNVRDLMEPEIKYQIEELVI